MDTSYPLVDEDTERAIGASLKDYKEDRFQIIDPSDPKQLARAAGLD